MSRFFSDNFASLTPYTPGEQPKERQYVKLNTNESPVPPAPGVTAAVAEQAGKLQLYSDPEISALRKKLAKTYENLELTEETQLFIRGNLNMKLIPTPKTRRWRWMS